MGLAKKKGLLTAASTLAIALGIGFVMQSGEEAQTWYGASTQPTIDQTEPVETELLDVQSIELTAAEQDVLITPAPAQDEEIILASVPAPTLIEPETTDLLPQEPACLIEATARALPGAIVSVSVDAPCLPNERLTVHHSGMMFTETTDTSGAMSVMVPALAEDAVFILAFAMGDGAVAQTQVADVDQFDRTVLQWRGDGAFSLHAREFGADYGTKGHVWLGSERDLTGIATGESGFVLQLGDSYAGEPLLAEVYTFPSARSAQNGVVDLSVESEVTAANCGAEIEAQTLERLGDGSIKSQDLILSVPDCSAVGDFLVLNNLVSDLTIVAKQ